MSKIPFDIKYRPQIESGEYKVETRDGKPVRIICWDRAPKFGDGFDLTLCVLIPQDNGEAVYYYNHSGKSRLDCERYDLFIVTPEEEMTEWQRFISACLQKHGLLDCGAADRIAKESAAELLKIAKKQINSDGYLILRRCSFEDEIYQREKRASEKAEAEAKLRWYDKGVEDGKAEALRTRATELTENLVKSEMEKDSISYHLIEFMCNLYACRNWKEIEDTAELYVTRIKAAALKDLPRWNESRGIYRDGWINDGFLYYKNHSIQLSSLEKLPGFKED